MTNFRIGYGVPDTRIEIEERIWRVIARRGCVGDLIFALVSALSKREESGLLDRRESKRHDGSWSVY